MSNKTTGTVYFNEEGLFLRTATRQTHTGHHVDCSWGPLEQATIFTARSVRPSETKIHGKIVGSHPATLEVIRIVKLQGEGDE